MSSSDSCISELPPQKEYIDVKVQNPTIHNTHNDGRFTTYEVSLQTNSLSFTLHKSVVIRRYSDFVWLRKALLQTTTIKPPSLPMGRLFGTFNESYLKERQLILTDFLQKIVRETLFLSSSAVHLFLQTQLDRKEMSRMLKDAKRRGSMDSIARAIGVYGSACTDRSACSTIAECDRTSIDSGHGDSGEYPRTSDVFTASLTSQNYRSSNSSLCNLGSAENNNEDKDNGWVVICDRVPINSSPVPVDKTAYTDVLWDFDSVSTSPIPILNCRSFNEISQAPFASRSLGNQLRLHRHSLTSEMRRVASDSNVPSSGKGKKGMFQLGESSDCESTSSEQSILSSNNSPATNQQLPEIGQKLVHTLPNQENNQTVPKKDQIQTDTNNLPINYDTVISCDHLNVDTTSKNNLNFIINKQEIIKDQNLPENNELLIKIEESPVKDIIQENTKTALKEKENLPVSKPLCKSPEKDHRPRSNQMILNINQMLLNSEQTSEKDQISVVNHSLPSINQSLPSNDINNTISETMPKKGDSINENIDHTPSENHQDCTEQLKKTSAETDPVLIDTITDHGTIKNLPDDNNHNIDDVIKNNNHVKPDLDHDDIKDQIKLNINNNQILLNDEDKNKIVSDVTDDDVTKNNMTSSSSCKKQIFKESQNELSLLKV